jgi:hypothetical protein
MKTTPAVGTPLRRGDVEQHGVVAASPGQVRRGAAALPTLARDLREAARAGKTTL